MIRKFAPTMTTRIALASLAVLALSACKTTPDVQPIEEVQVEVEPVLTCYPIETLTKVDIPAVTKTVTTVVLIDNHPYEPLEKEEQREVVIEEARVAYVNAEGQEVVDICDQTTSTTG